VFDRRNVAGEVIADRFATRRGQVDGDHPTVLCASDAANEFSFFQVVYNEGDVATGFQLFGGEVLLTHRSEMEQGLEHAELRDGQTGLVGDERDKPS